MVEAMRGIVREELGRLHLPELGVVSSIYRHSKQSDKDNYECNVRLKNPAVELRKVQIATQCIGLAGIPRVGDLVLVAFVNGDINAPVVIGRLYNDEDRPPINAAEEVVYVAPYSRKPDVRRIYLEFPEGMTFKITDDEVELNAGETRVTVQRNGDVVVQSKAKVTIQAEGDATIRSEGRMAISASNLEISSDNDMSIDSGSGFKLHSGNDMRIKSDAGTQIESSTNLAVDAGSQVQVKSKGMAEFTSAGQMTIRGAIVNIN